MSRDAIIYTIFFDAPPVPKFNLIQPVLSALPVHQKKIVTFTISFNVILMVVDTLKKVLYEFKEDLEKLPMENGHLTWTLA